MRSTVYSTEVKHETGNVQSLFIRIHEGSQTRSSIMECLEEDNNQLLLHKFKVIKLRGIVKRDIWKKGSKLRALGICSPNEDNIWSHPHFYQFKISPRWTYAVPKEIKKMRAYKVFRSMLSHLCDEVGWNDPLAAKHEPKYSCTKY